MMETPTGPLNEREIEHWLDFAGFEPGSQNRTVAKAMLWDFMPHRIADLASLANGVSRSSVPRAKRMLEAAGFVVLSTVDQVDGRSHVYTVTDAPTPDGRRPKKRSLRDAIKNGGLGEVWVNGDTIEADGPDGKYLFRFTREGLTVTTPHRDVQIV